MNLSRFHIKKTVFILLTSAAFIFYSNSLYNGYSLDDEYITNALSSVTNFKDAVMLLTKPFNKIDYRPVPIFTFALEKMAFGDINARISHIINLLLYSLNAYLVYWVLQNLPIGRSRLYAIAAALIFIALPIHANTVNNLKSRDNILSMIFFLSSFGYFIQFMRSQNYLSLVPAAIFSFVALNCKFDSAGLLLVVPMTYFIFYRSINIRNYLIFIISLFAVYIAFELIKTNLIQVSQISNQEAVLFQENPLIEKYDLFHRVAASSITLWQYIKFMVIPWGYYFYFGYNTIHFPDHISLKLVFTLSVHLGAIIWAIYGLNRNRIITFSIGFFYATLLYCSNLLLPVSGIIADRYGYIASLGYCLLITETIHIISNSPRLRQKFSGLTNKKIQPAYTSATITLTILVLLLYLPFVRSRNTVWANIDTLLENDMPHLNDSYEANRIASTNYIYKAMETSPPYNKEYYFKALGYAKRANSVYPKSIYANETEIIAYFGLNNILAAEKKAIETIKQFDSSVIALDLMGDICFRRSQPDSAATFYLQAIEYEPLNPDTQRKYTNALLASGRRDSAYQYNLRLSGKHPESFIPHENLSFIYFNQKDTLNGLNEYLTAFQKGLKNPQLANIIQGLFIQYQQQEKARLMEPYTRQ